MNESLYTSLLLTIPVSAVVDAMAVSILLIFLCSVDLITKWFAIAKQYCIDFDYELTAWNLFRAIFFRAWLPNYLESNKMRESLWRKLVAYPSVILCGVMVHLLPDWKIAGVLVDDTIAMFLYLCLVSMEFFSIAENLKMAGIEEAGLIEEAIKKILTKYIGITFTNNNK